jgi:hypothetical protein
MAGLAQALVAAAQQAAAVGQTGDQAAAAWVSDPAGQQWRECLAESQTHSDFLPGQNHLLYHCKQ